MASSEIDTGLEHRLRSGDESVLETILRTQGPAVRAVLRSKFFGSLTEPDFEDVLATALFRLWQSRDRFDATKSSLRVWFFRIAANVARDVFKHGWHKARRLEQVVEPVFLADIVRTDDRSNEDDASLPELLLSSETLAELLAVLPDSQRRIVLADAASAEGVVPSQQLADELGIPSATVRVYRKRALERLRREIDERGLVAVAAMDAK